MNIQEETNKILAQRLFSHFDSKKLVDWTIIMMQNGYHSESLVILAGLDNSSTEEREHYFWNSLDGLNINTNKSDFKLIDNYAIYIAGSVINKKIDPHNGLYLIQDIVHETNYSSKYIQFFKIFDDLDSLKYIGSAFHNTDLSLKNSSEFITEEFNLFIQAENLNNTDIWEKAYCHRCNQILIPKLKAIYNWQGKKKYQIEVCRNCGSKKD